MGRGHRRIWSIRKNELVSRACRLSKFSSLHVPIENELQEMLIYPKIRLPKTRDCGRQVDESVLIGKINQAQRSLNRHPPPLSFAATGPIIDEQCIRTQFFGQSDGIALAKPESSRKSG